MRAGGSRERHEVLLDRPDHQLRNTLYFLICNLGGTMKKIYAVTQQYDHKPFITFESEEDALGIAEAIKGSCYEVPLVSSVPSADKPWNPGPVTCSVDTDGFCHAVESGDAS
jgi:hypothetical protein